MDMSSQCTINRLRRLNILRANKLRRQRAHVSVGINCVVALSNICRAERTQIKLHSAGNRLRRSNFPRAIRLRRQRAHVSFVFNRVVALSNISGVNRTHIKVHSTVNINGELETVLMEHLTADISRIPMINNECNCDSSASSSGEHLVDWEMAEGSSHFDHSLHRESFANFDLNSTSTSFRIVSHSGVEDLTMMASLQPRLQNPDGEFFFKFDELVVHFESYV